VAGVSYRFWTTPSRRIRIFLSLGRRELDNWFGRSARNVRCRIVSTEKGSKGSVITSLSEDGDEITLESLAGISESQFFSSRNISASVSQIYLSSYVHNPYCASKAGLPSERSNCRECFPKPMVFVALVSHTPLLPLEQLLWALAFQLIG
jgi:hypothetical protein